MPNASNNHSVKQNNRLNTLKAILNHGRISQPALAKMLNHSGPTVLQNVKELSTLGLVQEAGDLESTGGRKAKAFSPIANAQFALGIDITKHHVGFVIIDLVSKIQLQQRIALPFAAQDDYFKSLGNLAEQTLEQSQIPLSKLSGIGIALPGIVDQNSQRLISSHVLQVWDFSTENFSRYMPASCFFINDANASGFAELHRLEHAEHLVYLSLSNSVGGAILHMDQLYMGEHQRSGEFGHMTLIPNGRVCYCGKTGCFDAYCNAEILSSLCGGDLDEFFRCLPQDLNLQEKWQEYLSYLAVGVNNLHMIFDCDVMVGGYVGSYLQKHAPNFRDLLSQRNTFTQDCSYFKYCTYHSEAAAVGAALQPLESFIQQICFGQN